MGKTRASVYLKYNRSAKGRARAARYDKSDKRKAAKKRYNRSALGKLSRRRYECGEKGKQVAKRYHSKPATKEHYKWLTRSRRRLQAIQAKI